MRRSDIPDNIPCDGLFVMGKFRPAKPKKRTKPSSAVGAIPCLVLLVTGIVLLSLLFYSILKSG